MHNNSNDEGHNKENEAVNNNNNNDKARDTKSNVVKDEEFANNMNHSLACKRKRLKASDTDDTVTGVHIKSKKTRKRSNTPDVKNDNPKNEGSVTVNLRPRKSIRSKTIDEEHKDAKNTPKGKKNEGYKW
ncbi:hypothetical protein HanPSC8_Chr01g0033191 [Helianthus annuus]|nr:hypothetical protein HanPSC8_Chr01g0033191 [Helianthus annuus]